MRIWPPAGVNFTEFESRFTTHCRILSPSTVTVFTVRETSDLSCRFFFRLCGSTLSIADRKSTRLNSSHGSISYAVFCLKKKNRQWLEPHHVQTHLHRHQTRHGAS